MYVDDLIKQIKFQSELNQTEIAKILGCSQVSVSRIRRGKQLPNTPLLLKIVKLAHEYKIKVKLEDLLPGE